MPGRLMRVEMATMATSGERQGDWKMRGGKEVDEVCRGDDLSGIAVGARMGRSGWGHVKVRVIRL